MNFTVDSIVEFAASQRVSDIHLVKGLPPKGRIDGQLENLTDKPRCPPRTANRSRRSLAGRPVPGDPLVRRA